MATSVVHWEPPSAVLSCTAQRGRQQRVLTAAGGCSAAAPPSQRPEGAWRARRWHQGTLWLRHPARPACSVRPHHRNQPCHARHTTRNHLCFVDVDDVGGEGSADVAVRLPGVVQEANLQRDEALGAQRDLRRQRRRRRRHSRAAAMAAGMASARAAPARGHGTQNSAAPACGQPAFPRTCRAQKGWRWRHQPARPDRPDHRRLLRTFWRSLCSFQLQMKSWSPYLVGTAAGSKLRVCGGGEAWEGVPQCERCRGRGGEVEGELLLQRELGARRCMQQQQQQQQHKPIH